MRFFRPAPRVLPAQPTEAGTLSDLYRHVWSGCERLLDPRLLRELAPPPAEVAAWFNGGFELYLVRHEDHLIGAVRCCFPSSTCYVDRLAVHPDAAGRGVGQLLLQHAISRARRAGMTRVWAQVCPKLAAARAVHRSLGFRECDRILARQWGEEILLLELAV